MLLRMRLAEIRRARGLNQDDLAEMIGVHKSTISRAESMDHTVKLDTYRACADALNVDLTELFVRSEAEAIIVRAFRKAEGAAREMFLGMAEKAATLPAQPPSKAS